MLFLEKYSSVFAFTHMGISVILMVLFFLSTPVMRHRPDFPRIENARVFEPKEDFRMKIDIYENFTFFWGSDIRKGGLYQCLVNFYNDEAHVKEIIRTGDFRLEIDADASWGQVVDVMHDLRNLGVQSVKLVGGTAYYSGRDEPRRERVL